ncbi:caspase-8 isoform X2 [Diabrotica virgifera virgifera]|uniref:Caspase-8-like n=1 Tax=Diabrotica virgifera virgifera TaxID=50390 RepID=A0A6P7FAC6_DIAVI|nr:caspase-8 isoform X2 [Diabrotica virgifera virgifera]
MDNKMGNLLENLNKQSSKYDDTEDSSTSTAHSSTEDLEYGGEESIDDQNETIDAAIRPSLFVSLPSPQDILDLDKVKEIESQLDSNEIISLIYLLIEDRTEIDVHLQTLILLMEGGNRNVLFPWAEYHSHKGHMWQNKLIEALCIIKHYKILNELGYSKQLVKDHYLPNNIQSLQINKLKKAVYLICDNFDSEATKTFLKYMRQNFMNRQVQFNEFDVDDNLELYFLNWESNRQLNFEEIKSILKKMEQYRLYDMLCSALAEKTPVLPIQSGQLQRSISPAITASSYESTLNSELPRYEDEAVTRVRKPSSVTSVDNQQPQSSRQRIDGDDPLQKIALEDILRRSTSPLEIGIMDYQNIFVPDTKEAETSEKATSDKSSLDRYEIDLNRPGVVLIINQRDFFTEPRDEYHNLLPRNGERLEVREGTNKDRDNLINTFIRRGFKNIIVANNLNHIDMLEKIKDTVNKTTNESSLFVCILSHGNEGVVYGCNSCHVKVSKIQEIMSNKNFNQKPKVLILQSCQGRECLKVDSKDDDDSKSLTTDGGGTTYRDMLTFWATFPGYAAIRNKQTGTWFIQNLCQAIQEDGDELHFVDICTKVNQKIHQLTWKKHEEIMIMTPLIHSTFNRQFYLPKTN